MSPIRVVETPDDLETCFALRHRVFVEEQGVPLAEERDAQDATATHLLAVGDAGPLGTARILFQGDSAKIGRVCVLPAARGTGLGAALIKAAMDVARQRPGVTTAKLGAQIHALTFYEKLGFEAYGPVYVDAGIDHRDMRSAL
ncbi:MAG: GNAT family N-acetyltransferase [Marinibacterium sp.]|nr:GNAT family N-acetyltransferase [Marinibacterium sp.]